MGKHCSQFLKSMRNAIESKGIKEVDAFGCLRFCDNKYSLFPSSVYGFGVQLDLNGKKRLFNEAVKRKLSALSDISKFKPIFQDIYPIYWGKDKCLGTRPYQHLGNPVGTGSIRLSTYKSLKGKNIFCAVIIVDDDGDAERVLKDKFPCLLKTTIKRLSSAHNKISITKKRES